MSSASDGKCRRNATSDSEHDNGRRENGLSEHRRTSIGRSRDRCRRTKNRCRWRTRRSESSSRVRDYFTEINVMLILIRFRQLLSRVRLARWPPRLVTLASDLVLFTVKAMPLVATSRARFRK